MSVLNHKINTFYGLFGGGATVAININANKVVYNDINWYVKDLLEKIAHDEIIDIYNYIEKNIKDAEEAKATWQENEKKSEATILASNRMAADIVAEAKATAEKEKNKILDQTAVEIEKMKIEAQNDIARMEMEAQEEIRKEMVNIALDASKEVLGREVDSSDNNRLIEEFIDSVNKEE